MSKLILVVDDSPTELGLITAALDGHGYSIVTAVDGEEAIRVATEQQPTLVLLDVVLPKKNGFQVCRHIKTTQELEETKVVLVTSKAQESDKFWGLKQGADSYLTKPFDDGELLETVRRFV